MLTLFKIAVGFSQLIVSSLPLALGNGLQWNKKEGFSQNPFHLG
jgi:hypothetical protein